MAPDLYSHIVRQGESLYLIAQGYELDIEDLLTANPGLGDAYNLQIGQELLIPTTSIAETSVGGITVVVSLKEKRLTLKQNGHLIASYPVAIGRSKKPTPSGTFTIVSKQANPGGPYGSRWLGLSQPGYGIHGTNSPRSIGQAVSHGCVRMLNKDVEKLYSQVSIDTPVSIY